MAEALDDKTQNEVVKALHKTCSQRRNLAHQCMTMVDLYSKSFFSEVSTAQPEGFCKKVGLCRIAMVSSLPVKRNKCDVCHQTIDEVLDMLNDPYTVLGIIERLLRACNAVGDKYKSKFQRMVFEYGPLLLVNAGSFVEKLDICTTFHACTRQQHTEKEGVMREGMIKMVTSSQLSLYHL